MLAIGSLFSYSSSISTPLSRSLKLDVEFCNVTLLQDINVTLRNDTTILTLRSGTKLPKIETYWIKDQSLPSITFYTKGKNQLQLADMRDTKTHSDALAVAMSTSQI